MSNQARNQLGTLGVAKRFLRGTQIFHTMSNSFQLCSTDFSRGGEKVCRETSPHFPPAYGPVSNSFKVCPTHFSGEPKIVLASYGPGFVPWCCVDRLATVEALKTNVHLLLLWLARLQISRPTTVCECLSNIHSWSVSMKFNSQLRVWVTGWLPTTRKYQSAIFCSQD